MTDEPTPAQIEAAARALAMPHDTYESAARAALTAAAQVQPEPCPDCRVTAAHDEGCPTLDPAPEADEREALALLIDDTVMGRRALIQAGSHMTNDLGGALADAILAAGFRRSQPAPRPADVTYEAIRAAVGEVNQGEWGEDEVTYQVEFLAALFGWRVPPHPAPRTVSAEVAAERERQIAKGYTPQHDDEHGAATLAEYAAEYAGRAVRHGNRSDLIKAAALLEAATETVDRLLSFDPASRPQP